MAKITDPDFLNNSPTGEVVINPTGRVVVLQETGNLTSDGVTLQAVYSFLKEEWRTDSSLIKYPFPMEAITPEQFEFKNSWNFSGTNTRNLVRDGGWAVKDAAGISTEEWMNLSTLGSFYAGSDRAYYQQSSQTTGEAAVYQGPLNQAIRIYSSGEADYRSYFKIFLRGQGETYDSYDLITNQNIPALTYKKYALPLSNGLDLKISASDAVIATGVEYTGVRIQYYSSGIPRSIGTGTYLFNKIIDGSSSDKQKIYEKIQYQLRQNSDIDIGTGVVTGRLTDGLLEFVGDTLVTNQGVFIDNIKASDINSITFTDISGIQRNYPYTAAGTLSFNDNLKNDGSSKYWMYFTSVPSGNFGSSSAVLVQDSLSANITGLVSGRSSVDFTFNYDSNTQGGRTAGTDAQVTVVGIGLSGAQYVSTTATIQKSVSNNISLISVLERNYSNV
jgi:hypothetical protein